jgi:hypothetical protein
MKRAFVLLMIFAVFSIVCEAQLKNPKSFRGRFQANSQQWKYRRWELMTGLGTSQMYGDIGGYTKGESAAGFKDFSFSNLRFSANGGMRYWIDDRFAVRLNLTMAGLHSSDSKGSNEGRAFESSTFIFEPALLGEVNIIKPKYESMFLFGKNTKGLLGQLIYTINVYGFAGVGGAIFSVDHNITDPSLKTSDGGFAAVFPVGLGVRMQYNTRVSFGIEWSNSFALSDYIDGYTSDYSNHNDMYRFLKLTWCYKLRTGKHGGPVFRGAGSGS